MTGSSYFNIVCRNETSFSFAVSSFQPSSANILREFKKKKKERKEKQGKRKITAGISCRNFAPAGHQVTADAQVKPGQWDHPADLRIPEQHPLAGEAAKLQDRLLFRER